VGYLEANQKSDQEPANTGFKLQPHHAWVTNYNASIFSTYRLSLWEKKRSEEQIFMFYVWDETAKQEQSAYSFK
jgi:hypothetical protein